jgi:hypothetical protein
MNTKPFARLLFALSVVATTAAVPGAARASTRYAAPFAQSDGSARCTSRYNPEGQQVLPANFDGTCSGAATGDERSGRVTVDAVANGAPGAPVGFAQEQSTETFEIATFTVGQDASVPFSVALDIASASSVASGAMAPLGLRQHGDVNVAMTFAPHDEANFGCGCVQSVSLVEAAPAGAAGGSRSGAMTFANAIGVAAGTYTAYLYVQANALVNMDTGTVRSSADLTIRSVTIG